MSFYFFFITFQIITIIYSIPSCNDGANLCRFCNILTNICAKCEISDILIPDENGGCTGEKKCIAGKNYCKECDLDGKLCKTCEDNYYRDENGGCSYSEGCEISSKGDCLKCKEDFILVGKVKEFRLCKSLLIDDYKNCQKIDYETGLCTDCEEGYFLTSVDKKCIKKDNCRESIFGNCISCNYGYYYNIKEDECLLKNINLTFCQQSMDGKICDICEDGYYFDDNGVCLQTQFCSESENINCKKCQKGYFLSNNNICTNTDNCEISNKYSSVCTSCKNNYYLDTKNYECISNLEDNIYKHCQKVVNNKCVKCQLNYFLSQNSVCSNSQFCEEAENGKCQKCLENYYLGHDNICTTVEKCIYSKYDSCIECEDGYYFNKQNNTCTKMHDQYLNCKSSCQNEDKCCECKDDFYLYENDSLCYDNTQEESFKKCAYVDNSRKNCNRCIYGYYLGSEDNKCCKVGNCKIVENENKCLECDTFHCLDVKKQECVDNDFIYELSDLKYISCKKTNEGGTACEVCIDGYQINEEGYCVDIDFCEEKKDGKCMKCKDILSVNDFSFCANEVFGCLETTKDNCLRCDNLDNLYDCTECKEGYIKTAFGCDKSD